MITKPAVGRIPIIVTGSGEVSTSPREVIAIKYVNTTAGAGLVSVTDGSTNQGVMLSSDAANGNDQFTPAQPMAFKRIVVTFITGTGYVCIETSQ